MRSIQSTLCSAGKGLSQAAALTVLAASGIVLANPGAAQAAPLCLPGNQALSVFITPCESPAGGFIFNLPSFTGFSPSDTISVNATSTSFTLGLLADINWAPGTYVLNYTLTAPPSTKLTNYTSSITSSVGANNGDDVGTWDVLGAKGIAGSTFNTPFSSNGNKFYSPQVFTSDTFTSTLTVTNGVIQSVTSTVNAVEVTPPPEVPGPLPLLGAGAAFGFSRKLRQRLKLAI